MYPDIEQRDFYPQLNGLSKIIKKDYLKIQGPQRSHKNCVKHFFRFLGGLEGPSFLFFFLPFFHMQWKNMYRKILIFFFFLNLKDLQTNLTIFRGTRASAGVNHPSSTSL